jgi:DNA-binding MarR family transcriptional regulator
MPQKTQKTLEARGRRLGPRDYERLAEFRHVLRQFLAFSREAAADAGLTPQQHQALLALKALSNAGAVTLGTLARQLDVRPHSAVGLVDRLAGNGLVERQAAEPDRRQVHLALTAKAESLLEALSFAHRDELERLAPLLGQLLKEFTAPDGAPPPRKRGTA